MRACILWMGAVALCAQLGANAAAKTGERLTIEAIAYNRNLTLPWPTWYGRKVAIEVQSFPGLSLLKPGLLRLPDGIAAPQAGYVAVQLLRGVTDVDSAKAHFKLVHGIDLDKAREESGRDLEVHSVPAGTVLTVDLGRLGWVPGNVYHYLILDDPAGRSTVLIGPTHRIVFDLEALRLERGKSD